MALGIRPPAFRFADPFISLGRKLFFVDSFSDLPADEKKRMLGAAHGLDRIMLLLMFETGLDVPELIKLRVSDVDLEDGFINLPGGRRLEVSSETLSEMKGYLSLRPGHSFLFEGRCGKPVTAKWKRCVLERLLLEGKA